MSFAEVIEQEWGGNGIEKIEFKRHTNSPHSAGRVSVPFKIVLLNYIFVPLLFYYLRTSHHEKQEQYWSYTVSLFYSYLKMYGGVNFSNDQYHLVVAIHSLYRRAQILRAAVFT